MSDTSIRAEVIQLGHLKLTGSLHVPGEPRRTGVVFLTGGMQTRAGSHRAFLKLARRFADEGFACLRFDLPGLGDSEGEPRAFDANGDAIDAALGCLLREVPGVQEIALWGLCDGASAAALHADARIKGLILVNPWLRDEQMQARAMVSSYYSQRWRSIEFWRKLFSGRVNVWRSALDYLRKRLQASETKRAAPDPVIAALLRFAGNKTVVIAGRDATGQTFLQAMQSHEVLKASLVEDADHTFSAPAAHAQLEKLSLAALQIIDQA